jgi:hypothetical protein
MSRNIPNTFEIPFGPSDGEMRAADHKTFERERFEKQAAEARLEKKRQKLALGPTRLQILARKRNWMLLRLKGVRGFLHVESYAVDMLDTVYSGDRAAMRANIDDMRIAKDAIDRILARMYGPGPEAP